MSVCASRRESLIALEALGKGMLSLSFSHSRTAMFSTGKGIAAFFHQGKHHKMDLKVYHSI